MKLNAGIIGTGIGLGLLTLATWLGEAVARVTRIGLPGPVLGMVFALAALAIAGQTPAGLSRASAFLIRHLALFFVPAAVGLVDQLDLLRRDWLPILIAVPLSTAIGMAVTALVFAWLTRHGEKTS